MSWRWSYMDSLLDSYYYRSRYPSIYPSSYYPSTYSPSSYYYPLLSDAELRYPYRVRSPLTLAGYPTYREAPRSWLPNWYPSYNWPRALRDPWWYDLPILRSPSKLSYPSLRHSYLSPIKRTYVWSQHPMRRGTRW